MTSSSPSAGRRLVLIMTVGIAYLATAVITVSSTRFGGGVAFIWISGAILLATLIISEPVDWIAPLLTCGVAGWLATACFGLGPLAASPLVIVNLGEAVIAAALMRRWCPRCGELGSARDILALLVCAGLVAPGVSAVAGAAVAHWVTGGPFWSNWLTWFAGHGLGAITVCPLVLLAVHGDIAEWVKESSPVHRLEALGHLAAVVATTILVFGQNRFPLLFLPFLPVMVSVFRIGRLGAAGSIIIVTAIGTYFTIRGAGPIALVIGGAGVRAQFLQLYLACLVLVALPAAGDLKLRRRTVATLRERSALHQLILDRTGDVILTLERAGAIRYVSPASERAFGLTADQMVGHLPHDFIHADDVAAAMVAHRAAMRDPDQTFSAEYRIVADGRAVGWFETHTRAMVDEAGVPNGAVCIIRDVTERRRVEDTLALAALTDPLTGVANRRSFDQRLASRLGQDDVDAPASIAMFDLDHFKGINDRHGHAAGDRVLCAFADVLRASVRDRDLVARYGGEEFVVLLDGATADQAAAICDRVRATFAGLRLDDGGNGPLHATVSVGVAQLRRDWSAEAILRAADAALYESKAAGRNRLSLAA